jgi:hypothetical protein
MLLQAIVGPTALKAFACTVVSFSFLTDVKAQFVADWPTVVWISPKFSCGRGGPCWRS